MGDISKGDQARADILDAARRLFVTQGYHGTSMRAIAREAGDRAVAGLYNHFPTKEAIFEALINERNPYEDLFGVLDSSVEGARTAPEFIRGALSRALRIMPRHYDFIQLAQIDLREFEGKNINHLLVGEVFPRVMDLIRQLQSLPGARPVEEIVWLRMIAGVVIGFMITEQIVPDSLFNQFSQEQWIERIIDLLLYGIADDESLSEE